jgi:type III secretion protein L
MVFIVRAAKDIETPIPRNKIIKAEDAWVVKAASEALAAGNARRQAIESAAMAAFEAEQRRGYLEGREQAKVEQSGNMIDIISRTVDYFAKVEAQMVDLVLEAVQRIINDFDDRQKVEKVVENCLSLVRNQQQIMIKVHPDSATQIRQDIHLLQSKFPAIEQIEVVQDNHLAKDACVIESDIGRVEASLSGQIEALRSTLERVFSMPPAESSS